MRGQVTQTLTLTRIVALCPLALAPPKRAKNYCLVIDWEDESAGRQNSVFEFPATQGEADSPTRANTAANAMRKYVRPKAVRLRPDEKKCPHCAEVIKSEAVICRFCKSNL